MEYIRILKNQHVEILELVKELSASLTDKKISQNLPETYKLLSKLSERLLIHLKTEDNTLYLDLLENSDEKTKELLKKYSKDSSSLLEVYNDYLKHWPDVLIIQQRADEFIFNTEQIIGLILDRIYNEENILFPHLE
jgi:hypothetical protein